MIVKVNCPIPGCGTQVQVQSLPRHLEKVHELDGELVLRLHPTATYQHTPAISIVIASLDQEPEEAESEAREKTAELAEKEGFPTAAEMLRKGVQEPEPEKELEPGEE